MKYEHITEGRFIDRPNRFIAHVEINGQVETVHVRIQAGAGSFWSRVHRFFWKRVAIRRERQPMI